MPSKAKPHTKKKKKPPKPRIVADLATEERIRATVARIESPITPSFEPEIAWTPLIPEPPTLWERFKEWFRNL